MALIDAKARLILPLTRSRASAYRGLPPVCSAKQTVASSIDTGQQPRGRLACIPIALIGRFDGTDWRSRSTAFSEGLSAQKIKYEGDFGFMDMTGRFVIAPQFSEVIQPFIGGRAVVKANDWRFGNTTKAQLSLIDTSGKLLASYGPLCEQLDSRVKAAATTPLPKPPAATIPAATK